MRKKDSGKKKRTVEQRLKLDWVGEQELKKSGM